MRNDIEETYQKGECIKIPFIKKYSELDDEYFNLVHELYYNARTSKKKRELHKRLKKYGSGVSFKERYPNLPEIILAIGLLPIICKSILCAMHLL